MQGVETAVKDLGANAINAVEGLNSASLAGSMPFIVGVLVLLLVVKFFSLPFKLLWNGVIGAISLWLVNLLGGIFGFSLHITVIKALIAGFFGVPGVVAILLWEIFIK